MRKKISSSPLDTALGQGVREGGVFISSLDEKDVEKYKDSEFRTSGLLNDLWRL